VKSLNSLVYWTQKRRRSIGQKLGLAFTCLIVVLITNTLITLVLQFTLNSTAKEERAASRVVGLLAEVDENLKKQQSLYFDSVLINRQQNFTDGSGFIINNLLNELQNQNNLLNAQAGSFNSFLTSYERLKNYFSQISAATALGDFEQALKIYQNSKTVQEETNLALKQAQQEAVARREGYVSAQNVSNNAIVLVNLVVSLGGLLMAVVMSLVLNGAISKPILQIKQNLLGVAEGRLEQRAQVANQDELGTLADAFNRMALALENNRALLSEQTNQITNRTNLLEYELNELNLNLASARHDLKGPLTNIRYLLELLEMRVQMKYSDDFGAVKGEVARTSQQVVQIVEDCARLINTTLARELHSISLQNFAVDQLLRRSVELVGIGKLAFSFDLCPPDEAITVRADYALLEHAVLNLIFNAKKFAVGKVVLGARLIPAQESEGWQALEPSGSEKPLNVLEVWVWNDGEPIPEGEQKRIFQVGKQTAAGQQAGGQGLGLAIVKSIAEKHGGYVQVYSRTDEGTRFTLLLPQYDEQKTLPAPDGYKTRDFEVLEGKSGAAESIEDLITILGRATGSSQPKD
jgi:signal transduction histidine kinase